MTDTSIDVVVIGSGPAGQKAAIQAAKAGKRVMVVERERGVGGACVHHGTIPSKTLRETAVHFAGFRAKTAHVMATEIPHDVQIVNLMSRMQQVVQAHTSYMDNQLQRNGIVQCHGRAHFLSPEQVEIESVLGGRKVVQPQTVVIASGSRPRNPEGIPVDHEHILDSDSVLSLMYLPRTMTVLGSGVVASEYASIFAALGVRVTIIDKFPSPLGFLEPELSNRFVEEFERNPGCKFVGGRGIEKIEWNGVDAVEITLDGDEVIRSEKVLCALGRTANIEDLHIEKAGLKATEMGHLEVTEHCQTAVPHIYAVGDVIGPPALASSSMAQGRRAMRHALGIPVETAFEIIPTGIYTIPEMSSVGLTEEQAIARYGGAIVGRAEFRELARGQIASCTDGLLRLVADPKGDRLLGVQIIGDGATELIHVGQMALMNEQPVNVFVETIFNFPTLAEAYRVAALDVAKRTPKLAEQNA